MSKREAASFLGVDIRSIERYQQKGKLHPVYEKGKNGNEAFYRLEELENLKSETSTPLHVSEVVGGEESEVVGGDDAAIASVPPVLLVTQDIVSKLAEVLAFQHTQTSPLVVYRELEEVADKKWILPTSTVKQLTGVTPTGKGVTRGSFNFVKSGKIGREAAWRVERV